MGQTDIRRLLIVGASCQRRAFRATSVIRWVVRRGGSTNRWLAALVALKPKMVAAVALANSERCSATGSSASRTARMIWALSTKQENYRMA
jgi:transposase